MPRTSLALAALGLGLALAACGDEPGTTLGGGELYALHGCAVCHGAAGEGRSLGPPLGGLRAHWQRESLAAFLLDPPSAIAGNPRLEELSARFPTRMLSYRNTTESERLRLADFLLALEE